MGFHSVSTLVFAASELEQNHCWQVAKLAQRVERNHCLLVALPEKVLVAMNISLSREIVLSI